MMTYEEVLDYLYSQLPMFQRVGAPAYKANLDNIQHLCEVLNHPEQKLKFIHIAGTNGKGSVSNMLAAIFQVNGYKTGLFTSPHLVDFRERIRVNGEMIPKNYIIRFVEQYKPYFEKIRPSFFEWSTALAFHYFYHKKVDIVILETGMGGRLDSTNVVMPELSVVTNIGEDHKQFLGDTLVKIAYEKSGIIKPNTPVLISEYQKAVAKVFREVAHDRHSPLIYAKEIVNINNFNHNLKYLDISYQINYTNLIKKLDLSKKNNIINLKNNLDLSKKNNYINLIKKLDISKNIKRKVKSPLNATYQVKNIQCVLAACEIMKMLGWKLKTPLIHKAIQNTPQITHFRGRWEVVQTQPIMILDIAHNKPGILSALQNLKNYSYKNLRILFGVVSDKEVDEILKILPKQAVYYFTQASVPRSMPVELLYEKVQAYELTGKTYKRVKDAIVAAEKDADKNDLILIFGSAFVVADALAYLSC